MPWYLALTRTADVYTVITDVQAFPTGVQFTVISRVRPSAVVRQPGPGRRAIGPGAPDGPLYGVGLADGTKAMVRRRGRPAPDEPEGPVLLSKGHGDQGDESRTRMWLWPLPPAGAIVFVTAWPTMNIAETTLSPDASELIAASGRAQQLWALSPMDRARLGGIASVDRPRDTRRVAVRRATPRSRFP